MLDRYASRYASVPMHSSQREAFGVTGMAAELLKLHEERKLMHQMLTDAGIPETSADGERTCLIGRLGVAVGRLG